MNALEIIIIIFLVCVFFYSLGIILSPKKTKRMKEKYKIFTGGESLPEKRPKYFSQLYTIILFFLIFDASILLIATGKGFDSYVFIFISLLLFSSLLISLRKKKL